MSCRKDYKCRALTEEAIFCLQKVREIVETDSNPSRFKHVIRTGCLDFQIEHIKRWIELDELDELVFN